MALEKIYTPIGWQNKPSTATPLGSHNLSKIDEALAEIDERVVGLSEDTEVLDEKVEEAKTDISENTADITRLNNSFTGFSVAVSQGMELLFDRMDEAEAKIENNTEDIDALKIIPTASGNTAYMYDASNMNLENIIFYGESTQNGEPTPTNPIAIESKVVNRVDVLGGQLLDLKANTSSTLNGFSVSVESGYILKVSGTPTAVWANLTDFDTKKLPKGKYTFSVDKTPTELGVNLIGIKFRKSLADSTNVTHLITGSNKSITLELTEDYELVQIYVEGCDTSKSYNFTFKVMLNAGETALPFEPYQSQTVNLSAPIELNGIGGVRDTIEIYSDGTGKYIQRIGKVVANKNTRFNTVELSTLQRVSFTITNILNLSGRNADVLSSHFVASIEGTIYSVFHAGTEMYLYVGVNNATDFNSFIADKEITFYYPIAEPIETSLPQADIDAIKALHTYKPNTVVMNDADAEMDVQYVADTKTYIDNKFEALASAIVNQ